MLGKRESVLEIGMNGEQLLTKIDAVLMGIAGASGVPMVPWWHGQRGEQNDEVSILWKRVRVGCGTPAVPPDPMLDPSFKALRNEV